MSKLRSIKIVSIGLLLAMLAVSCNPNTSLPAGNDKKSKTPPGPSTEEPARKIEELAQEPADNHQDHAAKLANLSEQGEEPATSSQEVPEQTQKSSPDEPRKPYQKLEGQAQEGTGLKARSNDAAQKVPASLNPRTEEDPNNHTAAPYEEEVTHLNEQSDAAQKAPASLNPRTETREEDLNNDTGVLEEKMTHLNERSNDAEQEVSEAEEVTQKIAQGTGKCNSLTKKSTKELRKALKVLDDLEPKLAADVQLIAELQEKDNKSRVSAATQRVNQLEHKVKKLKSTISCILRRDLKKRGWK